MVFDVSTEGRLMVDNNTLDFTPLSTEDDSNSVETLAKSYLMWQVGDFLNKYYFPAFLPFGFIGNILSFLVMVQPENRKSTMSHYLAAISVADTMVLAIALTVYLAAVQGVVMPPSEYWHCQIVTFTVLAAIMCSTLYIVAMTFERFYSIVRPHKAASFNTVKKAKITISFCTFFGVFYSVPHLFMSLPVNWQCLPYGLAMGHLHWEIYYWLSFGVNFILPFVILLGMNFVIIHKIRQSAKLKTKTPRDENYETKNLPKTKNSEGQVFTILLLVSFGFLILTTPGYLLFLFGMIVNFNATPQLFAGYYLFYNVAQKMHYTNHGINFLFYVISGKKFRSDLMKLFGRGKGKRDGTSVSTSTTSM